MFADVAGSTKLYEQIGDQRAREAISTCLEYLNTTTERHSGSRIKTIGDEVMCRFGDAESAVQAAMDMQRGLLASPPVPNIEMRVRIGLHFGTMIPMGDDVFGDAVNVAARMAAIARAGQIITTASTVKRLGDGTRRSTRRFDSAPVRGKADEIEIHEVLWESRDVTQMVTAPSILAAAATRRIRLACAAMVKTLEPVDTPCVIGRKEDCDFVVPSGYASRHHARIEYRRGKFILTDQSANGTYVTMGQGTAAPNEVYLRREELPLLRSGVICLGESLSKEPELRIQFDCE